LILELKANQLLAKPHEVQLVNYLVATGIDEGLLLNFWGGTLRVQEEISAPETRASLFLNSSIHSVNFVHSV
jgi:PD-(D/E)XK nuclease superfamily